jgi:hypothetical protein
LESFKADPEQGIGKWSSALTLKWDSLTEEEKAKYGVIAEQWKKRGPPEEVQRRLVPSCQHHRVGLTNS